MTTGKIIEIYDWYMGLKNAENPQTDNFSVNLQWKLRQNINLMTPIVTSFFEMRDELEDKLREKYAVDEYSEVVEGEAGARRIKPEYLDEYQSELAELNTKLSTIAEEETDLNFKTVNLDAEIESAFIDKNPTMKDIDTFDILMFMDEK